MINLSVGCNFGEEHIQAICDLIDLQVSLNSENRITSVYGSPGYLNLFGSVRPRRREMDVKDQSYLDGIQRLRNRNVSIMWTMNSLTPLFRTSSVSFDDVATWLVNAHGTGMFDQLIISHPGLIDSMLNFPHIGIIISTIMNVHNIAQINMIKEKWPTVVGICPALWRNRDLEWLKRANKIIPLELLANEFCSLGGVECEGLYRQTCYLSQSMDMTTWNPMDICRPSRERSPEAWLKAKFILPDWMKSYETETGVKSFKITGRTHPASFIKYVGEMYVRGEAHGNLLALWGMLEATYADAKPCQDAAQKDALGHVYPNIPVEKVAKAGYYLNPICNSENCSDTCEHCKRLYDKIMGEDNG